MVLPGNSPTLVTGRPELARKIFSLSPDQLSAAANKPLEQVFGAESVILRNGA